MLRKDKKLKDKLDTQVINLKEIKEVASTEKKIKSKKNMALLFLFLGLFLLVLGILYPLIIDGMNHPRKDISSVDKFFDPEKTKKQEEKENKLTCDYVQETEDLTTAKKLEFIFDSEGLTQYREVTNFEAKTEAGKEQNVTTSNNSTEKYSHMVAEGLNSIIDLSEDYNRLTLTFEINYLVFDLDRYIENPENTPLEVSYARGRKKEEITQQLAEQNITCK